MSIAAYESDWRLQAACLGKPEDLLFPDNPNDDMAVRLYCGDCPVRQICLDDALRLEAREGIRGGLTESKRAVLHDNTRQKSRSLIARKAELGVRRSLSAEDKLELSDLRHDRGWDADWSISARQKYRLRLGELYVAGVAKQELLAVISLSSVSSDSAERLLWRAIREYRIAYANEVDLATKRRNMFLAAAKNAPSEVARNQWVSRAAEIFLP